MRSNATDREIRISIQTLARWCDSVVSATMKVGVEWERLNFFFIFFHVLRYRRLKTSNITFVHRRWRAVSLAESKVRRGLRGVDACVQ